MHINDDGHVHVTTEEIDIQADAIWKACHHLLTPEMDPIPFVAALMSIASGIMCDSSGPDDLYEASHRMSQVAFNAALEEMATIRREHLERN